MLNLFRVKRKIIHIHDGSFFYTEGLLKTLFLKVILVSKVEFIVPSNLVKSECLHWNNISKVNVLYGYSQYEEKELRLIKAVRCINFYGNFQFKKGLLEFLTIVNQLNLKGNIRVNIIGRPDEISSLELSSLIHANRNSNYIQVVQISDPKELIPYSIGAIIVSPTHGETFGLAVLECMSLGMVPVVNSVGGLKEIIEHNYSGYLIENNSIEGYIECINMLLSNPNTYLQIRENAFNQSKRFSQNNFESTLLKILRDD
jgi:glycosyltransferase involved in cell wall biosynthesis